VFAEQIVASGGRCPWDGEPFSADYALVLVDALKAAEEAGTVLENALEHLVSLRPALTIDVASVTGRSSELLAELSKNVVTQG
jgi:hypothetical protein